MDILLDLNTGLLEFPLTPLGFAVLIIGLLLTYGLSLLLVGLPQKRLWSAQAPELVWNGAITYRLLALDSLIYVLAIQIGQPAGIGLWLLARLGGELLCSREAKHYQLGLIGAGSSLVLCLISGIYLFCILSTDWVR